jgi:hypothetical protein
VRPFHLGKRHLFGHSCSQLLVHRRTNGRHLGQHIWFLRSPGNVLQHALRVQFLLFLPCPKLRALLMKMSFFREIRRRSRASFRTNTGSSDSPSPNDEMPSGKSSSTIDSSSHSSRNTPPSSINPNPSSPYLPVMPKLNGSAIQSSPPPQRPVPISSQSDRNNTPVRHPHK